MPAQLLPASAAAFATRSAPNIVLNTKVDPWLTATLKRINRIKRPLNSVPQHFRCLTETLSSPSAIWTLCSLLLPKAPDSELVKNDNPLIEAVFNYKMVAIEAYIVHVDMVSQNEVAFKLTPETIEALVEYHKEVHSKDTSASTWHWSEKEVQLKKLQEDFVQAANKYVYRTSAMALEGLEEDGAGELLCGRAEEVKTAIMGLFLPLLPPPPRHVDVVRPTPVLPSSTGAEHWWQPTLPSSASYSSAPETFRYAPSNTVYTSADSGSGMWASMDAGLDAGIEGMETSIDASFYLEDAGMNSPSSSYSDAYSGSPSPPQYYSLPATYESLPATTAPMSQSISNLPLPSTLTHQQCGADPGFGGFDWPMDTYQNFAQMYAM
ncbi:hypothetical protein N7G274_004130 [Stereocaulon virgatum]|uniref:Uncharacterized protein n=1 Tax=Stereocaulon virgatum TaxID=373712 RepID=A0ABR4ABC2_9LECA